MITHDFRCGRGHVFEAFVAWDTEEINCKWPKCREKAKMVFLPRGHNARGFEPVVVFKDVSGNYRFPARNAAKTPRGFERVELRTLKEVANFESQMNAREQVRFHDRMRREEEGFGAWRKEQRKQLFCEMQRFSPLGRDMARAAMEASDKRDSERKKFNAGFHLEAFHFDSSNRTPWIDVDTNFKPKR